MSAPEARLVEFVEALRSKGVRAGPAETIDAAAVMQVLGLDDRSTLREGLAAALVRRGGQRDVFDQTFDLFFPSGIGTPQVAQDIDEMDVEQLRALIQFALAETDLRALEDIARIAVDVLGPVGEGDFQGWSAHQTLERLQPGTLIAGAEQLRSGSAGGSGPASGAGSGSGSGFADRLHRDEIRQAVEAFRQMVAAEARRRTAEVRGRDVVTRHAVRTGSSQVDFLSANRQELAELRRSVQPLARKLATRLAIRRRRARRGKIDIRRTLRKSLGTGGVPINPAFAKPRPGKPDLVLLCDVSGSVAGFSNFTMLLVQALSAQFSKVRVFAFVNAMDEVTDLVKETAISGGDELSERIRHEARITNWHMSSDYGESLLDFREKYLQTVGPRSTVLILGDARNNNQHPRTDALHEISARSKRTFWLNPEHPSRWGLGDSEAKTYAEIVEMHQCSNIDQLADFITRLLPV